MEKYDRIIIGMGAVGISALRHLSKDFDNVLGIEKGSVPNPDATSYGLTRLIQFTSYTDYSYIPILKDAVKDWESIEKESEGRKVFHNNGILEVCQRGSDAMGETIDFFREANIEYDFLSNEEINDRYNLFQLTEDFSGIHTTVGGLLDARNCIEVQRRMAVENGASINTYEEVRDVEQSPEGVKIETDKTSYMADKAVVCLGGWTGHLFPKINDLLTVKNHSYSHFLRVTNGLKDDYPAFLVRQNEKPSYYGLVEPSKDAVKYGVGTDKYENLVRQPPTGFTRGIEKEGDMFEVEAAKNHFSVSTSETNRSSCMICYSPDHHPIVGEHPDYEDIVIATGMSGHGFKFSNITGKIIADISNNRETEYNSRKFSPQRFDFD